MPVSHRLPNTLEQLDAIFLQRPPISPIPQMAPPLSWLHQCDHALAEALYQLHESAWMFCVHRWHRRVVASLRQAGHPHLSYIRHIRWNGATYLLDDLFDTAVVTRHAALQFAFFTMTTHHEIQLARVQASSRDTLTTALLDLFRAMASLRTEHTDLHGVAMPFTVLEAMQAFRHGEAYGEQGQVNECKRVTLAGHVYFMKTYSQDASGLSDPALDQRNEAAVAAGLRAWHPHLAPMSAYHLIGANGDHFSINAVVTGKRIEDPARAAQKVSLHLIQMAVLAEKIMALTDRHWKNAKIDGRRHMLSEIDLAPAFRFDLTADHFLSYEDGGSLGTVALSHARAIWEAHPECLLAVDGSPLMARQVLVDALTHRPAIEMAVQPYVSDAEFAQIRHEFDQVAQVMQRIPGDISLRMLEQKGKKLE